MLSPLVGSEKKNSIARESKGKASFQRIEGWKEVSKVEVDHVFFQALTFEIKKKSCGRADPILS